MTDRKLTPIEVWVDRLDTLRGARPFHRIKLLAAIQLEARLYQLDQVLRMRRALTSGQISIDCVRTLAKELEDDAKQD